MQVGLYCRNQVGCVFFKQIVAGMLRIMEKEDGNTRLAMPQAGIIEQCPVEQQYFGIHTDDEITGILEKATQQPDPEQQSKNAAPEPGLLKGLAGEGLLYLTALHRDETLWLNLF
jgi:hypothetical protein